MSRALALACLLAPLASAAETKAEACARGAQFLVQSQLLTTAAVRVAPGGDACLTASTALLGALDDAVKRQGKRPVKREPTPADVEAAPTVTGTHGGAGQGSAAPTIQPTPLAAASLSALSTATGAKALAELRINPLGLLTANSGEHAWATRTLDVVVALPTSAVTALQNGTLPPFDYVGVRVRANLIGFVNGEQLVAKTRTAFTSLVAARGQIGDTLDRVVAAASDPATCIKALGEAIQSGAASETTGACGEEVPLDAVLAPERAFQAAAAEQRADADRRYLGLDLRGDFGDPRFTGQEAERGTRFIAAVAFGHRVAGQAVGLTPGTMALQVRGRVGFASTYLTASGDFSFAVEGALAANLEVALGGGRRFTLDVGFDGRGAGASWGKADANVVNFVGGLSVPITESAAVTVGVTLPILTGGDATRKPTLAVSGNWDTLLRSFGAPQ